MRRNTRERHSQRPSHLVDRDSLRQQMGRRAVLCLVPSNKRTNGGKEICTSLGVKGPVKVVSTAGSEMGTLLYILQAGETGGDLRFVNYTLEVSFVVVAATGTPTGIHVSRVYCRIAWV